MKKAPPVRLSLRKLFIAMLAVGPLATLPSPVLASVPVTDHTSLCIGPQCDMTAPSVPIQSALSVINITSDIAVLENSISTFTSSNQSCLTTAAIPSTTLRGTDPGNSAQVSSYNVNFRAPIAGLSPNIAAAVSGGNNSITVVLPNALANNVSVSALTSLLGLHPLTQTTIPEVVAILARAKTAYT